MQLINVYYSLLYWTLEKKVSQRREKKKMQQNKN